jgi:23S rRNA (guanosine2251-2'-O)-methyltransferase
MAEGGDTRSPRERYLTVFGRQTVLEALADRSLVVAQVFVADDVERRVVQRVRELARARGIELKVVGRDRITRLSGTGKQHQGVAADIEAPNRAALTDWIAGLGAGVERPDLPVACVLLDGITTPANVGMIIRAAVGAGLQGIVVPTHGVADLGPLVMKASAGVAFRAPLLRVRSAAEAAHLLSAAAFELVALDAHGPVDLWQAEFGARTAFVLGGEHDGLSDQVAGLVTRSVRIPLANDVESLNVATAGTVVFYEWMRRRLLH